MGVLLRKNIDTAAKDIDNENVDIRKLYKEDIKLFIKYSLIVAMVFVAISVDSMASALVAIVCCVWAMMGPDKAIQSLTMLAFVRFFNPALSVPTVDLGMISWVLLLLVAGKNIPWGIINARKQIIPILVFGFFAVFLSMVSSNALDISLLKIISFLIGSIAIISVYNRMSKEHIRVTVIWLFSLMSVVVFFSILVLPNKVIAYNLNGVGFQGVLNHPQTLGAFLAPLTAFVVGRFVFDKNKIISIKLLLICILIALILLTQARTAAVSVFISVAVATFFLGVSPIKAKIMSKGGFALKAFGGAMVIILALALYPPAQEAFMGFVFKRDSASVDEALSSRARGYSSQLDNFMSSPIMGHGFGVYPGPIPSKNIRYFYGLPISAAVEKGFLPTAVLEEVGIVGAFAFLYLIVALTRRVLQTKDPGFICLYFACLFINIGEAVFFAVGGMGVFYWSLIGLSTVVYKKDR